MYVPNLTWRMCTSVSKKGDNIYITFAKRRNREAMGKTFIKSCMEGSCVCVQFTRLFICMEHDVFIFTRGNRVSIMRLWILNAWMSECIFASVVVFCDSVCGRVCKYTLTCTSVPSFHLKGNRFCLKFIHLMRFSTNISVYMQVMQTCKPRFTVREEAYQVPTLSCRNLWKYTTRMCRKNQQISLNISKLNHI